MEAYLDYTDPTYREAAAAILERHKTPQAEANITSAIRDFLIKTKLVKPGEIDEEKSPAFGSRHAVDLTALETFIEVKGRIGRGSGFVPDQQNVDQLDGYLAEAFKQGRHRMGILTDGKHWLLRWPNLGPVKTLPPYGFILDDPERGYLLFEWLHDRAFAAMENRLPDRETLAERFSVKSPSYERDIETLRGLYRENAATGTIGVKRQLWETLLTAALGEIAFGQDALDDLFVRHTYLTAVVGMVVQARFGLDIVPLAESNPADLLRGASFRSKTGLQGIVESDFFTWPTEVEDGLPLLKTLARAVTGFNWQQAPTDVASILYETVIPPEERRQLGEYYTPDWLARTIVEEIVTEPLTQEVLDPACGSGSFIAEAVRHFLAAAEGVLTPEETLEWLRLHITGMDIHPVAVHLARSAWALAAEPALQAASGTERPDYITAPIYLGDSLQTRYRNGDMFSERIVGVEVEDGTNRRLEYPRRLVEDADKFDSLMGDIASAIERGSEPRFVLNDHNITDAKERETLQATIATLQSLHAEGRDHIWAYYTRNLIRPVVLANKKVDRIVGNPPWLTYNRTKDTFRSALERMSKSEYGIWVGGRYATHQDIAGLFFTRCVDLYLKEGGVIGMVMPHSTLQAGQYSRWRTGAWRTKSTTQSVRVNFEFKTAWDLEKLDPNTFFPIVSSVVFAERLSQADPQRPLKDNVERWFGPTGTAAVVRTGISITDTSARGGSPYVEHATQGAVIVPRCLFFIIEKENPDLLFRAPGTTIVDPRRGRLDKKPWNTLDLTTITDTAIETQHVFNVHLGETVVPYATLVPLKAVLPFKRGDNAIPFAKETTVEREGDGPANVSGGINLGQMEPRMRERWQTVSALWERHKSPVNKLDLSGQLDYYGKLSAQLGWREEPEDRPIRIVYTTSGQPTAALLQDHNSIVDTRLFWIKCMDLQEARYLLAVINSDALKRAVEPLMSKGLYGARDLHKHLWRLPIPAFDAANSLHMEIAMAGAAAEAGVARRLPALRDDPVAKVRKELRSWLRSSPEGAAVEAAVDKLLAE